MYLPNCQTTLVIALDALFLLFCIFINTTAYHLGRYEPSSPVSCCTPLLYKCASEREKESESGVEVEREREGGRKSVLMHVQDNETKTLDEDYSKYGQY